MQREMFADAAAVDISVVTAVAEEVGDLVAMHRELRRIFLERGVRAEFIYVFDGPRQLAEKRVAQIVDDRFPIRRFRMARGFGEAATLQYAFERAAGRYVITVPAHFQVDLSVVNDLLAQLDRGFDVVVTYRHPRQDPLPNRIQSRVFHWLIGNVVGEERFHDLTCGLRGLRIEAARSLELYGDLHRFIPLLAVRQGFSVTEMRVPQQTEDLGLRLFRPGVYVRRLLDILNVLLLTRFARKPLRFFGLIGLFVGLVGSVICLVLAVQRVAGLTTLTDRPLLLLGLLLMILGVQLASIGLLGEIIIFHSAKQDQPLVTELERDEEEEPAPSEDAAAGAASRESP